MPESLPESNPPWLNRLFARFVKSPGYARRGRATAAGSILLLALSLLLAGCDRLERGAKSPYAPREALAMFQLDERFRIELVASEPMVADPVAVDVDENGRMFVVEMPGYPLDTGPTGRVKLLEDLDGDGRIDRSTIFADSLVLPTGVMRWKKGILVTAAPDVIYLEAVAARMAELASDPAADPGRRADALRLVALGDRKRHDELARRLIDPREPDELRIAAVTALGRSRDESVAAFLLERLKIMTPAVRSSALTAVLRQPGGARLLIGGLESGMVQPWILEWRHRMGLVMSRDSGLRARARAVLDEKSERRSEVLARYQSALDLKGNAPEGAKVYERVCARCHASRGAGGRFGPDLTAVRSHGAYELLADILMPSRALAQGYESYLVELNNGGSLSGVIASQTSTAITLREEDGTERLLSRGDIRRMEASTVSAMPDQLESDIRIGEMADLLAFLKEMR